MSKLPLYEQLRLGINIAIIVCVICATVLLNLSIRDLGVSAANDYATFKTEVIEAITKQENKQAKLETKIDVVAKKPKVVVVVPVPVPEPTPTPKPKGGLFGFGL